MMKVLQIVVGKCKVSSISFIFTHAECVVVAGAPPASASFHPGKLEEAFNNQSAQSEHAGYAHFKLDWKLVRALLNES